MRVVLQANFTIVGEYINIVTNVLLALLGAGLVWRYVSCWTETAK